MNYKILKNKIIIEGGKDFCPAHILECGQVFCYKKIDDTYYCYPENKLCKVYLENGQYIIETADVEFFEEYFDLKTNYSNIKKQLADFKELKASIEYGYGIRILKQELVETIISFIISANNNIKRITNTLNKIRRHFNKKITNSYGLDFYAFPSLEELKTLDVNFFESVGAGYRAKYLVETIAGLENYLKEFNKTKATNIETNVLLNNLLNLKGVGKKVANCILLFAYNKQDVFPVDTWISKAYNDIFASAKKLTPSKMCDNLIARYKNLSGYAQQYMFYFKINK